MEKDAQPSHMCPSHQAVHNVACILRPCVLMLKGVKIDKRRQRERETADVVVCLKGM